jgi:hypothetical protein
MLISLRPTAFSPVALPLLLIASVAARAQNAGTLRGVVTDPSAAVVPNATVVVTGTGLTRSGKSDGQGRYTIPNLPLGKYSLRADASGFLTFLRPEVSIGPGQANAVDIALQIAAEAQEIEVADETVGALSVDASSNIGALVLKEEDLEALPDDPDDLESDLQALAGPAAGPNGAQFFVDGFSGGQLPPKSSIREIRINSNPFSSEFDRPGFGRIEVLTKPGTDNYHGQAFLNYGNKVFDSRNPLLATAPPDYASKLASFQLGGPINRRSSFLIDVNHRDITENALVNAVTGLDDAGNPLRYNLAVLTPSLLTTIAPRVDYQLNSTNTLVVRYNHTASSNVAGVGQFNLPAEETHSNIKNNQAQITETAILGTRAVDETRFQFRDAHNNQTGDGNSATPRISVNNAFVSGGSPFRANYTHTLGYELQNIATLTQGTHVIKAGFRARESSVASQSTSNFNGTWTFTSIQLYEQGTPN